MLSNFMKIELIAIEIFEISVIFSHPLTLDVFLVENFN